MAKDLLTNDEYAKVEGFYDDSDRSGVTFFRIFAFQIAQVTDKPVDGWTGPYETTHPVTKAKKDNWYKPYDRFVARIVRVSREQKEFDASKGGGKVTNYNLTVVAGGKKAVLRLSWCEPFLKRFLQVAPNIDFTKPVCMSAWPSTNPKGKKQQAASFRQGPPDVAPKDWKNVPTFWKAQDGDEETKKYPLVGPDGSEIPRPEYDEDDGWNFKPQEKALAKYFKTHIMDKINAVGDALGVDELENYDTGFHYGANAKEGHDEDGEELTHTGPPQPKAETKAEVKSAFHDDDDDDDGGIVPKRLVAVTEKPDNPLAKSISDKINAEQNAKIKKICKELGLSAEKVAKKILGVDYEEASTEAGAYMIHKLNKKLRKFREENPEAVAPKPEPEPEPEPPKKAPKAADDDDDDWGLDDDDEKPAAKAKAAPAPKKDDDDDDEW